MGDRIFFGKIKKVTAGTNPKDAIAYTVGTRIGLGSSYATISEIAIDENLYEKYGKVSVVVWALREGESEARVYKVFIDVPITLSPDFN